MALTKLTVLSEILVKYTASVKKFISPYDLFLISLADAY